MKSKITALIVGLCLTTGSVMAQDWEFGLFIGPAQYQGDLSQSQVTWKYTRPQGGALARYNLNPRISLKGGINFGNVKGDDKAWGSKWSQEGKSVADFKASGWKYGASVKDDSRYDRRRRNLNFSSNIFEVTAQVEWNIFRFIPGSKRYRWTPYLLAGFSVFHFNPKTKLTTNGVEETYKLRDYMTELDKVANGKVKKYSLISFAIPTGIGVKYNLGSLWSVAFEMAGRKTFTDWLDDTHANYPGNAIVTAGSIDQRLSDRSGEVINPYTGTPYIATSWLNTIPNAQKIGRGDPKDKDTYIFTGFTISKTIRKYGCTNF